MTSQSSTPPDGWRRGCSRLFSFSGRRSTKPGASLYEQATAKDSAAIGSTISVEDRARIAAILEKRKEDLLPLLHLLEAREFPRMRTIARNFKNLRAGGERPTLKALANVVQAEMKYGCYMSGRRAFTWLFELDRTLHGEMISIDDDAEARTKAETILADLPKKECPNSEPGNANHRAWVMWAYALSVKFAPTEALIQRAMREYMRHPYIRAQASAYDRTKQWPYKMDSRIRAYEVFALASCGLQEQYKAKLNSLKTDDPTVMTDTKHVSHTARHVHYLFKENLHGPDCFNAASVMRRLGKFNFPGRVALIQGCCSVLYQAYTSHDFLHSIETLRAFLAGLQDSHPLLVRHLIVQEAIGTLLLFTPDDTSFIDIVSLMVEFNIPYLEPIY